MQPLDEIALADLGIEASPALREVQVAPPEARQK